MSNESAGTGMLHLLLSADRALWRDCIQCCQTTDTVVLLDAAVMALTWPDLRGFENFPCPVVVSGPDAEARIGKNLALLEKISEISDEAFVGLLEAHPRCLSWR